MAVPDKSGSDAEQGLRNSLSFSSLLGVLYLLGTLVLVFWAVPSAWAAVLAPHISGAIGPAVNTTLLMLVDGAVAIALAIIGFRLAGPEPPRGLRGGIFLAFVGLLVIAFSTAWMGYLWEYLVHDYGLFGGAGPTAGAVATGAVGVILLYLIGRLLFRPGFEKLALALEEQGWFSLSFYKRSQGLRVRRGTILGILVMAGCGIFTLVQHRTATGDWQVSIPFTGSVPLTVPADLKPEHGRANLEKLPRDARDGVDRFALRDALNQLNQSVVMIKETTIDSKWRVGKIVTRQELEDEKTRLEKQNPPGSAPVEGPVLSPPPPNYLYVSLLPQVKYSVPVLLVLASIWLAFRLVNWPVFADFLIATEAEMNKVSWTPRKRLVQDTIVVLTTVVLLTVFLLVVDLLWGWILTTAYVMPKPDPKQDIGKEQKW